jgi:DNA topoisomerase-2
MPPKSTASAAAAAAAAAAAGGGQEDLNKYQKMTDREHILRKPDTYIGTIERAETMEYVMDASPTVDIIGDATSAAPAAPATLTRRNITYIPGLYKLFDEGMVNMRDHVVRQAQAVADGKPDALPVTTLEVEIDLADGTIHMTNDGNGIDVAQHPEHKLWVPEMIFGHLRTSTNYDENKKEKIVGGKNGFGFKLVLIWSVWGRVETVDHIRGLKYVQEFKNNLSEIVPPVITKSKVKPYTRVSFRPDYARFGLPSNNLTSDMIALFMKRTYDIAAVTDKSVKVKYNGALVPVRHFQQYVDLYIGAKVAIDGSSGGGVKRIYENPDPRWEYVVCLTTTDEFAHVSFVNGIYTPRGGKHVEYITNQIVRKLAEVIKKKKKVDVKPNTIKEQLMLFLRCDIDNPSFSSQTKDELGTAVANFGSSCKVSDEFIEKLAKMGVMDAACALTEVKLTKAAKKTDGAKTKTIRGIPKLIDANYAGSADKSAQCTIILCEGDSAKAGIISGLSKEDRNYIGVYPMKGKLFNVHGETTKRISENREIAEIKQILGLETGKTYTSADVATRLRYGKVLFMTDQDLDGAHIQGLGINLFQTEWPSLTKIPGFIGFMNTPILKARRGAQQEILFYNDGEYEAWKKQFPGDVVPSGWTTKYYKGLGTSTGKEFKEYFEHKKMVSFVHTGKESDDHLDMAFNKKRADDRKEWLSNYSREAFLDTSKPEIPYEEFIDRGLIHFSIYDNERSIPNLMDGLKISLRKILYAAFKKGGLKTEIKVAQFSGYVSEHSAYHHGEASLNAAIVGMAQNFVGSNNINLLEPNGQFGTRVSGGDDSASERYIFTQLNKLTRLIYRQEDDAVLSYIDDDGQMVEPIYYAPAIPMILVNGTKGIGTGFSTEVLQYNPLHIIAYVRAMLASTSVADRPVIEPYFKGFKGTIRNIGSGATNVASATSGAPATNVASATSGAPATNVASATSGAPATNVASATSGAPATNVASATSGAATSHVAAKYLIKGTYEIIADRKVRITELPIGTWTDDYKEFLEKLMDAPAASAASDKGKAGTAASSSASSSSAPVLKEYNDMSTDTVVDITVTFHPSYPHTPKDLQAAIIDADAGTNKLEKLLGLFTTQSTTNMNLFDAREKLRKYATIYDIIEDYYVERLSLYSKRKAAMLAQLTNELRVLTNRARYIQEVLDDKLELRRQTKEAIFAKMTEHGYEHIDGDTEFKYLLKMPMDSVSDENVRHLLSERDSKRAQHKQLADTSIQALWTRDLDELEVEYKKWVAAAEASVVSMASKGGGGGGAAAPTKKKMVVKKA